MTGIVLISLGVALAAAAVHSYRAGRPGSPQVIATSESQIGRVELYLPQDFGFFGDLYVDYLPRPTSRSSTMEITLNRIIGLGGGYRSRASELAKIDPGAELPVLAIRLSGDARVDPATTYARFAEGFHGSVRVLPDSEGKQDAQLLVLYEGLDEPDADGPLPAREIELGEQEFVFGGSTLRPVAVTDNARTVAFTPELFPESVCDVPAGDDFIAQTGTGLNGSCTYPAESDRRVRTRIPSPSPVRIDYANQPPTVSGVPEWGPLNYENYQVSYANINEEAADVKDLFFSAAWLGIATAVLPIGVERLLVGGRLGEPLVRWLQRRPHAATPRSPPPTRPVALRRPRRIRASVPSPRASHGPANRPFHL